MPKAIRGSYSTTYGAQPIEILLDDFSPRRIYLSINAAEMLAEEILGSIAQYRVDMVKNELKELKGAFNRSH